MLANGSLFAGFRVAVVHNAEELKTKRDVDLLAEYAARPLPDTALLLLSAEVGRVDKRIERLATGPNKVIFWELFESQKQGWVNNFFRSRGLQVQPQAVAFLLDMVENNTRELQAFCEKLALYFGSGSSIGLEDVEKVLYHSKEETAFTLFEKLSARDLGGSLEVLAKILLSRDADAVALLAVLAWQFRRLYAFQRLLASNCDAEEAARRLEIRGKRTQQTYSAGRPALRRAGAAADHAPHRPIRLPRPVAQDRRCIPALLQLYLYYAVVRGGLPASGQVAEQLLGCFPADPGRFGDRLRAGRGQLRQAAESLQKGRRAPGADAPHPLQHRGDRLLPAQLLVEGGGEAVGLVPHGLQQAQRIGGLRQQDRVARTPAGRPPRSSWPAPPAATGATSRAFRTPEARAHLSLAAVHQDQVGQAAALVELRGCSAGPPPPSWLRSRRPCRPGSARDSGGSRCGAAARPGRSPGRPR